jgi:hypothetical protein
VSITSETLIYLCCFPGCQFARREMHQTLVQPLELKRFHGGLAWLGGRACWACWTLSYQGTMHEGPAMCRCCMSLGESPASNSIAESEPDFQVASRVQARCRDAADSGSTPPGTVDPPCHVGNDDTHDTPGTSKSGSKSNSKSKRKMCSRDQCLL